MKCLSRAIQFGVSYSNLDLARVELSPPAGGTLRFNMPLELGMTVTWAHLNPGLHTYFVFESEPYRMQRSTSELNGADACIHRGTAEGVLSELRSALWRNDAPTVTEMLEVRGFVENCVDPIVTRDGARDLFAQSVFRELCWLSTRIAEWLRNRRGR